MGNGELVMRFLGVFVEVLDGGLVVGGGSAGLNGLVEKAEKGKLVR